MVFQRAFSNAKWEQEFGYCRAIRAGNYVYVTGTAPIDDSGNVYAPGDGYAQARRCLKIIQKALDQLGAKMSDVVRTRMFVTDISRMADFGRAHREVFADNFPATTMVEVQALVAPEMLIEIEADAVVLPES